jgi:thiaminase (transcriptional activator TenA)
MKLSTQAWNKSASIYNGIINHPFNQELMRGTLSRDRFAYYIEQDSIYLQDFSRCHSIISSKIDHQFMAQFIKYAEYTLIAEQDVVHHFFNKLFAFKATGFITSATLSYTSYMLRTCLNEQVEVGFAALLPCFWIYREVGLFILKNTNIDNQYYRWIETYSSEDFSKVVDQAIEIFDIMSSNVKPHIQEKMLDAFYKSACLEWHFWNDAYNKNKFDEIEIFNSAIA